MSVNAPHLSDRRAPSWASIRLDRLAANLAAIRGRIGPDRDVLMAVKANAYGHGAIRVAQFVEGNGLAQWFGVATVDEGVQLRAAGVRAPILKLSPCSPGAQVQAAVAADLTLSIGSIAEAEAAQQGAQTVGRTAEVHLVIDTGMRRIGVRADEAEALGAHVSRLSRVRVTGVFTHFPVSDSAEAESVRFTAAQITALRQGAAAAAHGLGYLPQYVHGANSGGVLGHPESWGNLVRPGIVTYGYYPDAATQRTIAVEPVLQWHTQVTYLKRVRAGESVSYGRTWTAPSDTWVATLPVGYADGYRRLLSNRGKVLAHGCAFPVVGRVCMDQMMINVGPDPMLSVGDEVTLLGSSGELNYSADDMAAALDTISYEVLTLIGPRVAREYHYAP